MTMSAWFAIEGLRVPNNKERTTREFALSIDRFEVEQGKLIFLGAARKSGKSALKGTLKAVWSCEQESGRDLVLKQCDPKKPDIQIRSLQRPTGVSFHEQEGNPDKLPHAGESVFVFCDDPMFPPCTSTPSGPQIIDRCRDRGHTLLITADPDRLPVTFRHFLKTGGGRVLWLHGGMKYFDGTSDEFLEQKENLCRGLRESDEETIRLMDVLSAM